MSKILYRLADSVIANSGAVASDGIRTFGISKARLSVIPNPLVLGEIDELSRVSAPHSWLGASAPPLILGVGRLDVLKDFRTLISAYSQVRGALDCRLAILGDGPERGALDALARELGVQDCVLLPGFVRNPFVWMRNSALVVNSSLTEGCPNVVLQALACDTPVVCTDCPGGSAEILEDGRWGRLVPVGDSAAMADAMMSALKSEDRVDGRRRAADFSHEKIVDRYVHVLTDTGPAAEEVR